MQGIENAFELRRSTTYNNHVYRLLYQTFKLWCWRRLLRVPSTARSNQSILKEINPEYSLEGLFLKLKLQYFGRLMQRVNSLEKTLMLGMIEGRRRRGRQRMRWLNSISNSMDVNLSKLWDIVKDRRALWCCSPWDHKEWNTAWKLSNNTITPHGNHNPKFITHTKKKKESEYNTEDSYQITREQKRGKKRPTKTNSKPRTK